MRTTILLPLLAILAAPALAAGDLQLVQAGDHERSCPALGAEINALASGATPAVAAAPRKKGFGGFAKAFGSALPVLGTAVPVLGMLGGQGGAVLMQAAGAAGSMGAQSAAHDAVANARTAADDMMLREQRKQRLLAIFEERHC